MTDVTFDNIQHLIESQQAKGSRLAVTFRCPDTGAEVAATAKLQRQTDLRATAVRSAKKSMWTSLRRSVTGAIADVAGRGAVGKVAREVANSAMKDKQQSSAHSAQEVECGVVEAFRTVQSRFRQDPAGRWVARTVPESATSTPAS